MKPRAHRLSETGLYQQEVFKILAEYELARSLRYPNPITLLHISLNLKNANPKTKKCLTQTFAGLLNTSLRISDIPAYYGDDYPIFIPVTDDIGGRAAILRLISRLKGIRYAINGKIFDDSIHIGIASHPGESITIEKLMTEAEQALQEARKQGPEANATNPS